MKIANRKISKETFPLVIAELGINHGGNLTLAKKMVEAAAKTGCEAIKHQTHFIEDEMTEDARKIIPPTSMTGQKKNRIITASPSNIIFSTTLFYLDYSILQRCG